MIFQALYALSGHLRSEFFAKLYGLKPSVKKEIGMVLELSCSIDEIRCDKSGVVQFESTMMVDVWWSVENDDFHVPWERVPELDLAWSIENEDLRVV